MIATAPTTTRPAFAEDRRLLDRDDAVCDAIRTAVNERGLTDQAESEIWMAARRHIDQILILADHATVARVEADAELRRIAGHLRNHCTMEAPCALVRLLGLREKRLRKKAERAYQELAGRRR